MTISRSLPVSALSPFLALTALCASCSSCSPLAGKPRARTISPEAAAIFARADQPSGGALVIDLDAARDLGWLGTEKADDHLVSDLLVAALAGAAAEIPDDDNGQLAARVAVLVGLTRDWAIWPEVQRVGLLVGDASVPPDPKKLADSSALVLAVRAERPALQELHDGLAAVDRASGKPHFAQQGEALCSTSTELPVSLCVQAGAGFVAVSTLEGLKALSAPSASGTAASGPPSREPGPLFLLRAAVPLFGRGEVRIEGKGSLRLSGMLEGKEPMAAEKLEQAANELLKELDGRHQKMRKQLGPALDATRTALAADAAAPAGLKTAAAGLTVERLLDPDGAYAATRGSLKVLREGNKVSAEVTFPEAQVKRVAQGGSSLGVVAAAGVAAAVAIPNFLKYQCRAKQSEVKMYLRSAYVAQRSYFAEKDRYADDFAAMGFAPEKGSRYTYCLRGHCLPCTADGCLSGPDAELPCRSRLEQAPGAPQHILVCAAGLPGTSGSSKTDLWMIGDDGAPENVEDGCE